MKRMTLVLLATLTVASFSMSGEPARTTLSVTGLGCAGCQAAFERHLARAEGVLNYVADAAKGQVDVSYDPGQTDAGAIGALLLKKGLSVRLMPWETVDASFDGCSNGFCGSRRPNARVARQPGAALGQDVYCPVSGVVLRIKETTPRAELDGKPVYVCCEGCLRHLKAHRDLVLALRGLRATS